MSNIVKYLSIVLLIVLIVGYAFELISLKIAILVSLVCGCNLGIVYFYKKEEDKRKKALDKKMKEYEKDYKN